MPSARRHVQPIRLPHVERLEQTLSDRDWAIAESVHRVRLMSGLQLERLHFGHLSHDSRPVMRWRVLKRLVDERVLIPLERRVGTARHGSAELVLGLDSVGQRLLQLRANREAPSVRIRRPRQPGERFVAHTLAVSELYVALVELSRTHGFSLDGFHAEPAAWWPNGLGGWMKPDAFVKVRLGQNADYWWFEADLATESLPTLRAKLLTYLDFVSRGQLGPDGIVPRVLIGVPTTARQDAIQTVIGGLPEPAEHMFLLAPLPFAARTIFQELAGW